MKPIPIEDLSHYENLIYLPMVLTILARDRELIEKGPFKLKSPYLTMIDRAVKIASDELRESKIYMKKNGMQLVKGDNDGTFTEYEFVFGGYGDRRRYLNVRLRNRTEELMSIYFDMATLKGVGS